MTPSSKDVTQMFTDWRKGDPQALDKLMPLVYDELHRLADHYLRHERPDHTLQATALVHEAYLRLVEQTNVQWQDRAHFLGIAARLMRQILVEHVRSHQAAKRGGRAAKESLEDAVNLFERRNVDLVALDDALTSLAALSAQKSRIVELRFFGGLTEQETAEVLGVSERTVRGEWTLAKAWLHREISRGT